MLNLTKLFSNSSLKNEKHIPVLENEIIQFINKEKPLVFFDATIGTGILAISLMSKLKKGSTYIGIDLDENAINEAKNNVKKYSLKKYFFVNNFKEIDRILESLNLDKADVVLADLGFGSHQLNCGRGFTFKYNEKLNMSFSIESSEDTFDAYTLINNCKKETLVKILKDFGEEYRWANRIVDAVLKAREEKEILYTQELAELIKTAIPKKFHPKKRHPATKTFQALRIAVNDELGSLISFLNKLPALVNKNGLVFIISFHSLEDRITKNTFLKWKQNSLGEILTKKPITATEEELKHNPRSRSAKLRIFKFY